MNKIGKELVLGVDYQSELFPVIQQQNDAIFEQLEKLNDLINEIEAKDQLHPKLPELKQDSSLLTEKYQRANKMLLLAKKHSSATFLVSANPTNVFTVYRSLNTIKKTLEKNDLQLSEIEKALGEGTATDWLKALLFDMMRKLEFETEESDIDFLSLEIFEKNKMLTLPEVALVIRRIITGYYGELYNKANALKIMPCFDQHRQQRAKVIQEIERENRTSSSMAGNLQIIGTAIKDLPDDSFIKQLLKKSNIATVPKYKLHQINLKKREIIEAEGALNDPTITEEQTETITKYLELLENELKELEGKC